MKEAYVSEFQGRSIQVTIQYEDYDPDKSHDGGSYYQPVITAECGNDVLTITDTSCGDFGTRIHACLYKKNNPADSVTANYGSMVSDPYTEFSITNKDHVFWMTFASNRLNYHILYNTKYYFINIDVDPDVIYGNGYPVCLDEEEYTRLINQEGWTDLPELMHEAEDYEVESFGYYDSTTNEIHYGTVYENVSPWEEN